MHNDLLTELVRRYSPSEHEQNAVDYLVGWMSAHGFSAYRDEVGNAYGIRGNPAAPNTLLLLGHIDTVEGDIRVRVEDGVLYGRGSVDAKGSLCTFAAATASAEIGPDWRVVVIGAVEEENPTSRGAVFVRDAFDPTMCIIGEPSGHDRITLGYKGRLLIDYCLRRESFHSAAPQPSVGAIGTDFWQQVVKWCDEQNADVERHFDRITPNLRNINTSSNGLHDTLQMTVGFRLPPNVTPETVSEAVSTFAPSDGKLHHYSQLDAYYEDKNNNLVRAMLRAIRSQGNRPGFVVKTGTSDMNVVGPHWSCPIIAYGPGDSSLDHTPNEHIELDAYNTAIATLTEAIQIITQ